MEEGEQGTATLPLQAEGRLDFSPQQKRAEHVGVMMVDCCFSNAQSTLQEEVERKFAELCQTELASGCLCLSLLHRVQ